MKLPVAAFLAHLKPTVGLQPRQQLLNLDRHAPTKILPRLPSAEHASLPPVGNSGHALVLESVQNSAMRFERITLYEAPAPIAGPCHEGLAPAPNPSYPSAVIFLGGWSAVNFFQRAELPAVMEFDPTDWFRRPKHARPGICGQRQSLVFNDIHS
jgi:hypothetical protein